MKQHITEKQWNELNTASKLAIATWRSYKGWDSSLLSIGQMVEILDENNEYEHWWEELLYPDGKDIFPKYKGELCDALWKAVKEVLEK